MDDVRAEADRLRRALARLQRRERERRDGSALALIDVDAGGRIVGWNREAERVFGWTGAEVDGRPVESLAPQRGGAAGRHAGVRKDGARVVCQWHAVALHDDHGAVDRVCWEVRDVTAEVAQERRQSLLQALSDRSPMGIFAKCPDGRYVYANLEFARSIGMTPAEVLGRDDFGLFAPDIAASLRRHDAEIVAAGQPRAREDAGVGPDSHRTYWSLKFPLLAADGEVTAICGLVHDISQLRDSERERTALQRRVIAELSTPLLPIAEGVLVMPLIGVIDDERARLILEALLEGVAQQRARVVILDVTGVRGVDARAAGALLQAARAARMLGAASIVTGVRPEVASALVEHGAELAGLVTPGSLRSGVEHALARARRR